MNRLPNDSKRRSIGTGDIFIPMGWDPEYVKCITCRPCIDWPLLILTASHLCMFCGKLNYVEVKITRVARVPSKRR